VFVDDASNQDEKIASLLDIGMRYYNLETAMLGMVTGHQIKIDVVAGITDYDIQQNQTIDIRGSVFEKLVDSDNSIASSDKNINITQFNAFSDFPNNCFIGAPVQTATGPYGVVLFSSSNKSNAPFKADDKDLSTLIANWIGITIDHKERIEFIENQNEYYQSLFRSLPAMTLLANEDGLILSTSDRLSEKLGMDPLTIPGKNCAELFSRADNEKLATALSCGEVSHLPLTLLGTNNKTLDVELNSSIKTMGAFHGIRMMVLADVSERNKAQAEIEDQNRRLAVANESLNQFAYIASHDLQEPLRKIQQFSGFLEEDLKDGIGEDTQYHINVISQSAARMSTLIRDLLQLSSAANSDVILEPVTIEDVMSDVLHELELRINDSNAKVILANLPTVIGEASLLRQLFTNLVSNSIKYCAADRTPQVLIQGFERSGTSGIEVIDNGIGFDMQYAQKIFEPFSRLHRNDQYHGTGIGLAICAAVCEKHHWLLRVESELEHGSKFVMEFTK